MEPPELRLGFIGFGEAASRFASDLSQAGLLRSICMKGLAALLLESLEAAQRYGIADVLAADMARLINGRPFEQVMKRFVCGTAIHAERRIHEMSESLALLRSLGGRRA